MLLKERIPKRMDVWYAYLPLHENSSVQGGKRPVIIVSNDFCNAIDNVITVIPMTHKFKRLEMPTHVIIKLKPDSDSLVLVEQIMTIDKKLLKTRVCELEDEYKNVVEGAIRDYLGLGEKE